MRQNLEFLVMNKLELFQVYLEAENMSKNAVMQVCKDLELITLICIINIE